MSDNTEKPKRKTIEEMGFADLKAIKIELEETLETAERLYARYRGVDLEKYNEAYDSYRKLPHRKALYKVQSRMQQIINDICNDNQ